jgi:hypothetical protein
MDVNEDLGLGDVETFTPRTPWRSLLAVFVNRDVDSSDSDFQPRWGGRWWARRADSDTGGRWAGWVWRQQPLACILGLALRLSTFAATLWWTAWLGFWLSGADAPPGFGLSTPPWLAALAMLLAAALGGAAGLLQELTMRRTFYQHATQVLAAPSVGHALPEPAFDRLRARDLLTLPDHLTAAVDLAFTPLALALGLAWLGSLFGVATAGSGAIAIAVALLATGIVGVRSLALAAPLVESGGRRMDLVSRWLDRRWFLLRWGRAEQPLWDMADAARRETDLMTRDSMWRGLEGYLSAFGIVFAVAGAVVAQALFGTSPNALLAYAWTLLPMIDLALSQSRVVTQCGQATQLLASVRQALGAGGLPMRPDDDDDEEAASVRWDDAWALFDASLLDNLHPERCFGPVSPPTAGSREWFDAAASWARCTGVAYEDPRALLRGFDLFYGRPMPREYDPVLDAPVVPFAISLLRHLRLADELWGDREDDLVQAIAFQVRDDGAALSAGQRVRLLFARAVLQARSRDLPLDVSHSLSALDADALRRARETPVLAGIEVNWGDENLALFAAVDAIDGARQLGMPASPAMTGDAGRMARPLLVAPSSEGMVEPVPWRRTAVARSAIASLRWFLPMALLAATGLFVLSQMLAPRPSQASWTLLRDMAAVAVPSLALVVAAGVMLERSMRRAALRAHADLLVSPGGQRHDLLQRLGRDFEVVTGRLAWYVHDLGWIAATAALGLLSLLVAFGHVGAGLAAAVAVASVWLWRTLAPKVIASRRLSAQGVNRYLALTANLRRLQGLQPVVRRELRRRYVARSLALLWRTQAASIGSKGALSFYASLLGAAVLAAACAVGAWLATPREGLVFVVAALVTVNRLGATFVQGLAGLMAQSLSARRLCSATAAAGDTLGAVRAGPVSPFVLPASSNPVTAASYARTEFPVGSMTLLVGPSGSGKTQFLRHHAERAACGRVLYFPRETPSLLDLPDGADWRAEVEVIVLQAARQGQVCVFLDELSTLLPAMVATYWLAGLHRCVQARQGMLIVVDHRLKLDRVLRLDEVVARVPATSP